MSLTKLRNCHIGLWSGVTLSVLGAFAQGQDLGRDPVLKQGGEALIKTPKDILSPEQKKLSDLSPKFDDKTFQVEDKKMPLVLTEKDLQSAVDNYLKERDLKDELTKNVPRGFFNPRTGQVPEGYFGAQEVAFTQGPGYATGLINSQAELSKLGAKIQSLENEVEVLKKSNAEQQELLDLYKKLLAVQEKQLAELKKNQ